MPASQTTSFPSISRWNVAKYDLSHSRLRTRNYSGPDSCVFGNYDLWIFGSEGKEVQPGLLRAPIKYRRRQ
jgi:hypothetical protein